MIASIYVEEPSYAPFIVRGVVPLPEGEAFSRRSCPYSITSNGQEYDTQWEVVSKHPDGTPSSVEFMALVAEPDLASSYAIVEASEPWENRRPHPSPEVLELLRGAVRLSCVTWDSSEYEAILNLEDAGDDGKRFHRRGGIDSTVEFYGDMDLVKSQGTPDYGKDLFGYTAWVSVQDECPVVTVDLVVHNGFLGNPKPDIYFKGLYLEVPRGWEVTHGWNEPYAGGGTLIAEQPNGHVMLQRQRREWRFVIHQPQHKTMALELVRGAGWGMCVDEAGLFSWNTVPSFGPQRVGLPDTFHLRAQARKHMVGAWNNINSSFHHGSSIGPGPNPGRLGPYHPWGVKYGGMTGGDEIDQWPWMQLLASPTWEGLMFLRAHHRANTDRHPVGLYEQSGRVVNVDQHTTVAGAPTWECFDGYFKKEPWGLQAALRPALKPSVAYEADLRGYSAHDWQHLIRRVGTSVALAWFSNDPIAKRELELNAALGRMGFFEGPGGKLKGYLDHAHNHPGRGTEMGRGQGWVGYTVAAAHCISPTNGTLNWLEMFAETGGYAQMVNGLLQRNSWGKWAKMSPFNGKHGCSQAIETGILGNAMYSAAKATGASPDTFILKYALGIWRYAWKGRPGLAKGNGTYRVFATAPLHGEPYMDLPKGLGVDLDGWQIGSLLGLGLLAEPDNVELKTAVKHYCGGGVNSLSWLKGRGLENIGNRAPLLFALE